MKGYNKAQVGDIRPSQILWTYGIGAIINLPRLSTIIMGLDEWDTSKAEELHEERLLTAVQSVLGPQVCALRQPPIDEQGENNSASTVGIPVSAFPRWMICPFCRLLAPIDQEYFKLYVDTRHPERTSYRHHICTKAQNPIVFPARFMIACEAGHLDDFPWHHFVHEGRSCNSTMRLLERGVTGEASDILVSCDGCHSRRSMVDAFSSDDEERSYHPDCTGRRPHLRGSAQKSCLEKTHPILLSASNAWFPLVYTTLALPKAEDPLEQLVKKHWEDLSVLTSAEELPMSFRFNAQLRKTFEGYSHEAIWQAKERHAHQAQATTTARPTDLKRPEWNVLKDPYSVPMTDDFRASRGNVPLAYEEIIEQVILVERLREVSALTGFTRIESLIDFTEEEELPKDHIMGLAKKGPFWVPAAEVHGEGIFLHFREETLQRWLEKPHVAHYEKRFYDAHRRWRASHHLDDIHANYPTLRYVLLHTFSHALMRQLTLTCGYTAASIRERIYTEQEGGEPMAGVLIYTAAADSEGTLGGLVHQGKSLSFHIAGALEAMHYCASDPFCAEHTRLDDNTLHGAACHACLFAPETSCERGNRYLDRSVLIPTVQRDDLAFFSL